MSLWLTMSLLKAKQVLDSLVSRLLTMDLIFIFISYFIFLFFSIFRTTWVRGYQSRGHISHKLMA